MWLLLFIIPSISSAKTGPDWMDYMLVIFKFLQVAVLFIIECWNNHTFLSKFLLPAKNKVHHTLRSTVGRGLTSISTYRKSVWTDKKSEILTKFNVFK